MTNISGPDPLHNYFLSPDRYEPEYKSASFTNNRQSIDLGFDFEHHAFKDTEYIKTFIGRIEKSLNLVLIMEYFDESMVLLKRMLGWSTGDILYFSKIKTPDKDKKFRVLTQEQKQTLVVRAQADFALYRHFLGVFTHKLLVQAGISEEVKEYRNILKKLNEFCDDYHLNRTNEFLFPAGVWTDPVAVNRTKCKWLRMSEFGFTDYFKNEQSKRDNQD